MIKPSKKLRRAVLGRIANECTGSGETSGTVPLAVQYTHLQSALRSRNANQIESKATRPVTEIRNGARTGRGTALSHRTTDRAERPTGNEPGRGATRSSQGFRRS